MGAVRWLLAVVCALGVSRGASAQWPQWRGPNGLGVSLEHDLPVEWSPTKNIAWKTEIPGRGHSSPVVAGGLIFLTAAIKGDEVPGRIVVALEALDDKIVFRITDNGIGLPQEHRDRLTEPYVTTRAKGTGLGLAIVRKILEDHGGELILQDAASEQQGTGAEVIMIFPPRQKSVKEKGTGDEQERIADRV